jgi:hypothetical protein
MRIFVGLFALFTVTNCLAQTGAAKGSDTVALTDSSSSRVIFFEDFNNNKNNWTIGENKNMRSRIDSGFYYLTATGHAYGELISRQ